MEVWKESLLFEFAEERVELLFSRKELCLQVKQSVASKVSSAQADSI